MYPSLTVQFARAVAFHSKQVIRKIVKGNYQFISRRWKIVSSDAKKFVVRLLMHDPQRRPSAAQALDDPWFSKSFDYQGFSPEVALMVSFVSASTKGVLMCCDWVHSLLLLLIQQDKVQASIQTFAGYGKLKKLALMLIAYRSSEISYLQRMFQR